MQQFHAQPIKAKFSTEVSIGRQSVSG